MDVGRDKRQWISRLIVTSLILVVNLEIGTSLDKFSTCNYNLELQDSGIHQGVLELGIRTSDSSGTRVSCDFDIDAGPGKHVMFYFVHAQLTPEGEQYDVSCIELKDNVGNIQTTVEDFPMKACFSTDIQLQDHVFATTGNKLSIRFYRNRGFAMAAGFRLIFTAFREESCRTSERKCANGRCIAHEIVCNDFNPCGDHSDCPTGLEHLSTLSLAGIIVLAILGGGTVIIIAAVCLQQGGRKRLGRQMSDWSTTYQSNGDVLEMQTEVITDDALAGQSCRNTNRNLQHSVSDDRKDLSQPAPNYSELLEQETMVKQAFNHTDENLSDVCAQLNASSPQESVTSGTLSSFPITTETHLPEASNSSQEQIGSEIFDSDVCISSNNRDNSSISTTAILHADYDNQAMIVSNNDVSADESKVLLNDMRSRQKVTNSVIKSKHNRRAPCPPDYKVVMKQKGRFHVHESGR